MTVHVNNQPKQLADASTVLQALQLLGITSYSGMAVAVNDTLVGREEWSSLLLQENDALVLIRASQGG